MSLGSVIGQDYTLPGVPGYQAGGFIGPSQAEQAAEQAQFAPAQGQAILPGLDAELAQIEGMTDEYYDTYSKLKSYVTEMNRLGIDVTKPDFTKPGGGDEFKTYKMFEAGLLRTANQLKNEYKKRQQLEPMFAKDQLRNVEGFDPTKQLYTETPDAYFSTELSPRTKEALDLATKPVYTEGDYKRQTDFLNREVEVLNEKIRREPRRDIRQKLTYERDQLLQGIRQTDLDYIASINRQRGQDNKGVFNVIKEPVAAALGGSLNYKPEYRVENGQGKFVFVDRTLQGRPYGVQVIDVKGTPKNIYPTIDRYELNENGEVYIHFNTEGLDPADAELIKPMRVDNTSPFTIGSNYVQQNFGSGAATKVLQAFGNIPTEQGTPTIYSITDEKEADQILSARDKNVQSAKQTNANLKKIKDTIKQKIERGEVIVPGVVITKSPESWWNRNVGGKPYKEGKYDITVNENQLAEKTIDEVLDELFAAYGVDAVMNQLISPTAPVTPTESSEETDW